MKAEIIAVGTELLMGYTVNTNSSDIAKKLLEIGIGTYYQQVVGDNPDRMREAIELASSRSNLIILTGGLGPTQDDITKDVLADYLEETLIEDDQQIEKINTYFAERGRKPTSNNFRQGLTISNGLTLDNEAGLACGFAYTNQKDQMYVVLPGPPFEMNEVLQKELLPLLKEKNASHEIIDSLYLNFHQIGESNVADRLDHLIAEQSNPTLAIYAQPRKVTVRVTASGKDQESVDRLNQSMAQEVLTILSEYFIGYGEEQSIEKYLVEFLAEKKLTLAAAESLTSGLVMESLSRVPGASKVLYGGMVTYQTPSKVHLLGVPQDLINEYTVVSHEVAQSMAQAIQMKAQTDFGLALTGVAGPDPLEGSQPGTVFIAIAQKGYPTVSKELTITGRPRQVVKDVAKTEILTYLKDLVENREN
ncbi:competence/damage-inducible protein A [Hutsoniella sourekii]|uniref:competence/damage-inducible protein A n=1 Tax=Hutsoniella sourekii TaxID=87650 RepID=UPI000481F5C3|nr:competence/damage-inducible protein A [Hutsoniella sourekii]